jgi:hypothetical protein
MKSKTGVQMHFREQRTPPPPVYPFITVGIAAVALLEAHSDSVGRFGGQSPPQSGLPFCGMDLYLWY